jgi:hypothetical protein
MMLPGEPHEVELNAKKVIITSRGSLRKIAIDAIGYDVSNEECQSLFTDAVKIINIQYANVTVASLDCLVWSKYIVK